MNEKWKEAIKDNDSTLSISSSSGNKLKIEKGELDISGLLKKMWIGLTLLTVATSALTVNEWSSRMDTIKESINSGKISTATEAVDSQFFVNRGANFKDSFLAVMEKAKSGFMNNEKTNIKFENSLIERKISFISSQGMVEKLEANETKQKILPKDNKKLNM